MVARDHCGAILSVSIIKRLQLPGIWKISSQKQRKKLFMKKRGK